MTRAFRLPLLLGLCLVLGLTACGRKGTLERPGPNTTAQPRGEDQPAESGGNDKAPRRPFILDGLLR